MAEFNINDLLTQDKKTIKENNKIGRPKKELVKNKHLNFYVTEDEHRLLKKLAEEDMSSLSLYLRKICLLHLKEKDISNFS